jgi:hypothetical protein
MELVRENRRSREATATQSASPRVCMPTWRNFTRNANQCGLYEAQDVLIEMDDVDLIYLDRDTNWGRWFKETLLEFPLYYNHFLDPYVLRKLMFPNPRLKKIQLGRNYDVFVATCNAYWDLFLIGAIERWKDHCKVSVCWIEEIWAAGISNNKYLRHLLSQFDYIFIGCKGSTSALSKAINRPCYWVPGGIDALRFSPFPNPPARVIDVYSIGRRYKGIHREMIKAVERRELFYVHDTLANTATTAVYDHQQHRDLFANIAKRSHYFMVAPPKMDFLDETRGQVEVGSRYFEGAAAGAVMIGEAPDCEAYRELFGWPEAVIQIQPDGSDVMAVLGDLASDPERMTAISRRNNKETLLRHDWVYRWNEMFRVAGMEPSPRAAAREQRLKDIAGLVASANENNARRRGA